VVPVDVEQVAWARRAGAVFGRGSGSPARLNHGDCFSYALAMALGRPLLCKGDDFRHTDVALVAP
jgi:ribonuclease VapC